MTERPSVRPASRRAWILPGTLIATAAILAATCVVGTLRRPAPPSFTPGGPPPREVGDSLVGPRLYTVDARDERRWRRFDFSRGAVVESAGPGSSGARGFTNAAGLTRGNFAPAPKS